MKIAGVVGYWILDSRGNPTVEVEVQLDDGTIGRGLVPSGASTGQFEALELRDGDSGPFAGKSVDRAVSHVNQEITGALVGQDATDQRAVDALLIDLDGTSNKSRLGANAILGVSMAVAVAAANHLRIPLYQYLGGGEGSLLPLPEIQIIGGGAHAHWATDVQDFLVIARGAGSFLETLEMTAAVYRATGEILAKQGRRSGVADEGGFWPVFERNDQPLEILSEAIALAGFEPGKEVAISLDIAASDLFDVETQRYHFRLEQAEYTSSEFVDLMETWCREYPIVSLEDPLADVDSAGWRELAARLCRRVQVIGDDLFTTNADRIREGIAAGCANSVLIKLNQIGTVSETLDAIRITQDAGWLPVISARSGETEDAFISHLAVATNAGQLKVGSLTRSERNAKWNEVIRIGRHLGTRARFLGGGIFERILDA